MDGKRLVSCSADKTLLIWDCTCIKKESNTSQPQSEGISEKKAAILSSIHKLERELHEIQKVEYSKRLQLTKKYRVALIHGIGEATKALMFLNQAFGRFTALHPEITFGAVLSCPSNSQSTSKTEQCNITETINEAYCVVNIIDLNLELMYGYL